MRMHETVHGFPGMLEIIDCMHWQWKNCPTAWRDQFTSGYKGGHPTMILEAVADHRLWIWHAYFSVVGSNNDINVLNSSTLFADQCRGRGPAIEFTANGRRHHMGYYLADGVCAKGCGVGFWGAPIAVSNRERSDAFLVQGSHRDVMYACIIMHNMIVEQEVGHVTDWVDDEAGPSSSTATPPVTRGLPMGFGEVLQRQTSMRSQQDHTQLMTDMIEEVWNRNRR
ncbi:uncharacterized protein LOC125217928 [Salvia hispanica]|uniref:uncharacterized protein LOC125217928 n=1 Tax=Salvia hispanica TaxID=49212 RepID=UPI0020090C9B|nr:uncharacterized protein LOC125217928 [Salvia hispanica]